MSISTPHALMITSTLLFKGSLLVLTVILAGVALAGSVFAVTGAMNFATPLVAAMLFPLAFTAFFSPLFAIPYKQMLKIISGFTLLVMSMFGLVLGAVTTTLPLTLISFLLMDLGIFFVVKNFPPLPKN